MPRFGEESSRKLGQCHEDLQKVMKKVVHFYDCKVIDGHRNKAKQNAYYKAGKSKLQFPNSKHNDFPSNAVDIMPFPIDWDDEKRFHYFAGIVLGVAHAMGIKLRWGGDWDSDNDLNDQTFNDLVHFELVGD